VPRTTSLDPGAVLFVGLEISKPRVGTLVFLGLLGLLFRLPAGPWLRLFGHGYSLARGGGSQPMVACDRASTTDVGVVENGSSQWR
jgi:hypothetical protein